MPLWKRVGRRWTPTTGTLPPHRRRGVPGKQVSMRKTREVLRLYFDLHLGQRQVARSAHISPSMVHGYLGRFFTGACPAFS